MMCSNISFNTYFDNGATSFPKPKEVAQEISRYLNKIGGPYGRSYYQRAIEVSRVVEEARLIVSNLLGTMHSANVVFTQNATHAINIVLKGISLKSKEIAISPLEHNAVRRPLQTLIKDHNNEIKVKILPAFKDGTIDIDQISTVLSKKTDLVIINHESNINGVIQPVEQIKKIIGDIPILLDCAQSLGHCKIEADKTHIDYIAFTGHKGLLGPTGIGGLFVKDKESLQPLIEGGTGSKSDSIDTPLFMPDKLEAGTPNIVGIFGLRAALLNRPNPSHSKDDFLKVIDSLGKLPDLDIYCAHNKDNQGFLFSINNKNMECSSFGKILFEKYGIETRVGLHCAPEAHKHVGTFPQGTLRISPSVYHTTKDFQYLIDSIKKVNEMC